ncbi:Astacin-like metalloendopeptidase [Strongyloides ratti]|uniref:Astacin-like metalloendopeptidase n=1 Tax=Strongyloides ratti TaxID=34506 RepID=A0A090KWW1_STRRB|nr:Astacin-like metalloendopeptidase [Strongyloides ratti]CEF59692.1 Astacin-like metalloendopeptidase [Strongyloides ratti]
MAYFLISFLLLFLCARTNTDQNADESVELNYNVDTYPPYPVKPKTINYFLVNNVYAKNIDAVFKSLKSQTCLIFEKKKNYSKNIHIHFFYDYSGDVISLACCKNTETKAFLTNKTQHSLRLTSHYIGRALGLTPEILREDRDKFVKMDFKNIDSNYKKYYENPNITIRLKPTTDFNYKSIMFLSPYYGSKNQQPIFKAKMSSYYDEMIGKYDYFTHNDKKYLNSIYCSSKCKNKFSGCKNGGYENPSCNACICPTGFVGKKCTSIASSKGKCGSKKYFTVSTKKKYITGDSFSGTCYFSIKSTSTKKYVKIIVENLSIASTSKCNGEYGLEIKHRDDKGADGLYLCGQYRKVEIPVTSNFVLLRYNVTGKNNKLKISYQQVNSLSKI